VDVDEPGRDDQARGVDLGLGGGLGEVADGGDAVAGDGQVGVEPGVAGAVDDLAVADDQVVRRLGGGDGGGGGERGRGGGRTAEGGSIHVGLGSSGGWSGGQCTRSGTWGRIPGTRL